MPSQKLFVGTCLLKIYICMRYANNDPLKVRIDVVQSASVFFQ